MEVHYPTVKTPATPEYVLEGLREWHRLSYQLDYGMLPRNELTFETTFDDWQFECDLEDWQSLRSSMNKAWQISIPKEEWDEVLSVESDQTLWVVCRLISQYASVYEIREETFFGKPSRPASTFLAIRNLLRDAEVDVSEIAPSTPLSDYSYKHADLFLGSISLLAPGALPKIRLENYDLYRIADRCMLWTIATLFFALIYSCGEPRLLFIPMALFLCYHLANFCHNQQGGLQLSYGELHTFRDLSELISAHPSAHFK